MKIKNLFEKEQSYWESENIKMFGLIAIHPYETVKEIQRKLNQSCKKYWNSKNPCLFANALINGELDRDREKRIENTFRLEFNYLNTCVDVYQSYQTVRHGIKEFKVACIPSVTKELSWLIGNLHYVPRITALKNQRNFICRFEPNVIYLETCMYKVDEDLFYEYGEIVEPSYVFNKLNARSMKVLQLVDKEVNEDNFVSVLKNIPIIEHNSVFNYVFSRMEYFKDLVLYTKKYAQPTKNVILGINLLLLSQAKTYTTSGEKYEGSLTLSKNKLFSLENFRTTVNIFNGSFKPTFFYVDSIGLFDSFKTVTTGQAGRQRLLLDNVVVKDGLLYIEQEDGSMLDMYQFFYEPQKVRLSCLSEAPFCNNDKPKRIMMNAKLTAQSVPLKDEIDDLTHRVLARVGFADLEGYSYGDSIIISESFVEKLKTRSKDILTIPNELFDTLTKKLTFVQLQKLFPKKHEAILMNMINPKITRVEDLGYYKRIVVEWEIPFRLGDKITNLHGAKGTVGVVLPDDQMPRLMNKVGVMEAGPLDVIISGFSTMRRGSLGQIFEAWSEASGIEIPYEEDYIANVIEKYSENMKTFSENSVVTYKGETTIMPVGYNRIMRIDQHASSKCSTSTRDSRKKLKLGEMEKLNLISNDCPNILKEISLRDLNKNVGGVYLMNALENHGKLTTNNQIVLQTATLCRTLGYDISINNRSIERSDYSHMDLILDEFFADDEDYTYEDEN